MTAVAPPPAALPTTTASSVAPVEANKPAPVEDKKPAEKPISTSNKSDVQDEPKENSQSDDNEASKDTNSQSPTNPTETSIDNNGPAATSGARSLFDLEPNPFEQSFSKGSQPSDRTTPPRGGDATSVKRNALPPLSSLTSPAAADPSQFPWLAGHSLRSGPLSPAMLAGPAQGSQQAESNANGPAPAAPANNGGWVGGEGANEGNSADQENFEPGNFRTGFTPGAGTGFTPGYNALLNSNFGGPLPMPSPNTAAFLNSITNVNNENGDQGNTNQQPPQDGNVMENRPPPSAIPPHLQPQTHGPVAPPLNPGNAVQDPSALNTLGAVAGNMNRGGPPGPMQAQQPYYPPGMHPGGPGLAPGMPPIDYAQQNANAASQAANGLFLLSQAHQELSKREREETQPSPLGKRGNSAIAKGPAPSGQKRKDPAPKGGAAKRSKKSKEDSESLDEDDMKDQKKSGRPETEEEKRRNFLERNRQAALKCRQRKKAWLNELQNKVETLSVENQRLNHTVRSLEDELQRMQAMLMQHRDCGLAVPPVPMQPVYGRPLR